MSMGFCDTVQEYPTLCQTSHLTQSPQHLANALIIMCPSTSVLQGLCIGRVCFSSTLRLTPDLAFQADMSVGSVLLPFRVPNCSIHARCTHLHLRAWL